MKNNLLLTEFIKNNPENWKDILSEKPYSIAIKEYFCVANQTGYFLFSYGIESDMSNPIVQECRGIILRSSDFKPVCIPFFKFFNVQESNAATIDWNTAVVLEKIDGSIIKVWHDNNLWFISTNGTVNAYNAELQLKSEFANNYGELFEKAFANSCNVSSIDFFNSLNEEYTYMFEIVSPFNKIVVPYTETKIYHIGTRNNKTLKELEINIGIEKPNVFSLHTLEDCLNSAQELPFNEEGYVVLDKNYNRVKIKSPAYVTVHHLRSNGVVTKEKVLELIMLGEQSEFLGYYPEYTDLFNEVTDKLISLLEKLETDWSNHPITDTRKDFALWATKTTIPACMFSMIDRKFESVGKWLNEQSTDKILDWIYRK